MSRVQISLPEKFIFSTQLVVQIADINYGQHLANDAILRLCHEARLRFLNSLAYSEMDVEGKGLIMADAAIKFINQGFYADQLDFNLAVVDITSSGFSLITQIYNPQKNIEIARVKNGMVFFDYQMQKIARTPLAFIAKFPEAKK